MDGVHPGGQAVDGLAHQDVEVLVVVDGSGNPKIDEVLAGFDDPRLRVVRHESNRGIAEAYNTIIREGRGELIGMLGDDDVCLLVGRYHDELTLHEGTWKISRLVFEIMWGERRADAAGYLESVGGRGPQVPSWP